MMMGEFVLLFSDLHGNKAHSPSSDAFSLSQMPGVIVKGATIRLKFNRY